jgi:hypothetical protein
MSKAIAFSNPARDEPRPDDARGRPGDEDRRRMRRGLLHRGDAARRLHDERLGQARLPRARGERPQVPAGHGREVRVRRGRRRALVLPELRRDLVRRDDVEARVPPPQLGRDRVLVAGVAEREEQADRHRLGVADVRKRGEVERLQLAVGAEAAADAVAALERDERLRMRLAQAIQMRTHLPAQVQQVLEALVAEVRGARAAPLEQRVRRHRRPVREPLDILRADGAHRREDGLLLPRRRRHLRGPHAAAVEQHGVRERPADVDAEDRHAAYSASPCPSAPYSSTSTA